LLPLLPALSYTDFMPGKTTREIEVKLRVKDEQQLKQRLAKIGAKPDQRRFEENTLYDTPDGLLRSAGRLLRLRIETLDHGRVHAVLTSKAPAPQASGNARAGGAKSASKHKERLEREVDVRDPAKIDRQMRAMGLNPSFRYEKYRTRFNLGSLHLDLDQTPVGTFLELEGQPKAIDRVAKALGYSDRDYIRQTYWDLFDADRRRRGSKAKNMLFTHKNRRKSKGSA
jgi:adenylate cyclase, class 2